MTAPIDSWFLKYIKHFKENDMFYATYGSFIHKLIEEYYRGTLAKEDMLARFLNDFAKEVKGTRPQKSIVKKYIDKGCEYFREFEPFKFNVIDVEKKVEFEINGIPFIGYIDYLGEKNGEYIIVDNKSRDLKPRSKRGKQTAKDKELDSMLKQLYIYSTAVKNEYGKFPKLLCFNCFKNGNFIEEPFNESAYNAAIEWVKKQVEYIKNVDDFYPSCDYFSCKYICGVSDLCCYNDFTRKKRWKK